MSNQQAANFLLSDGTMSSLIRTYPWENTALGEIGKWPQSLKTTVGIIVHSRFPMFLWWGPELLCLYNDAYLPSLGSEGKHPAILGMPAKDAWPEIWHIIDPLIKEVLSGASVWHEDQLMPIFRNGRIEDAYWTFSYSPVIDESGSPAGVLVTCSETTEKVINHRKLQESNENFQFAIEAAELATWDLDPVTMIISGNQRLLDWHGIQSSTSFSFQTALNAVVESDRAGLALAIDQAMQMEQGGLLDYEYSLIQPKTQQTLSFRAKGKALFNEQGIAVRFNGTLQDITSQKSTIAAIKKSEQQMRSLVEGAPFPIGVYIGRDLRIQFVNQAIIDVWGKSGNLVCQRYADVLPELEGTGIYEQLDAVFTTGKPFKGTNQLVQLVVNGQVTPFYFNYDFTPLFDESGKVYGIMNTAADVTELNFAKQKIEASEQEFRQLADSLPVMVWTTDAQGKRIFGSRKWKEFSGLDPMDETAFALMVHPEDMPGISNAWSHSLDTNNPFKTNVRLKSSGGDYQWFYVHGEPLLNAAGKVEKWVGAYTNINHQKKAEQELVAAFLQLEASEKKFRNTVQEAPLGISILSGPDFIVDMANNSYLQLVDKTMKNFVGKPLFDALPEVADIIRPLLTNVYQSGNAFSAQEFPAQLNRYGKLEDTSYFNLIYHPLKDEQQATWGVMVVATEVTEMVQAKQKLLGSEQQFRNLIMQSPIAMAIFTGKELVIEMANDVMVNNIWLRERAQVIGRSVADAFPEMADQKFPVILNNVLQSGESYKEQEAVVYISGEAGRRKFWLDYEFLPLANEEGRFTSVMVTANDVTERVLSRSVVEESEQRSRLAIEAAQMGTFNWNLQNNDFVFSDRFSAIFGVDIDKKSTHLDFLNLLHPDDLAIRDQAVKHAASKGSLAYQVRIILPDQTLRWVKVFGKVLYDDQQHPASMYGTIIDVTEEKLMFTALEESTVRLNIAVDSAELGTWMLDLKTKQAMYSQRYLEIMGYAKEDSPAHDELIKKIYTPDMPIRNSAMELAMRNGFLDVEMRVVPDGKNVRWVKVKAKVFYDQKNEPERLLGTLMEITEAKNSFNALQESEERFRNVANNAPVLLWMAGADMLTSFFNTAWFDFTGRTADQEMGNGWLNGVLEKDRAEVLSTYKEAFKKQAPFYNEYRLLRNDGEYRWVMDKGVPRFTLAGNFEGYIGACLDIHDSKLANQKIQKSELLFKTISNVSPVGLWMSDTEGQCTFVNDTWITWTGISYERQLNGEWLANLITEDRIEISNSFEECAIRKEKFTCEFRMLRPDGVLQWCLNEGSPFYDIDGNFAGYAGSVTDITERKLIEQELEIKVAARTAELKKVNDALEKSNTELEQFAYVASHDLQEPLRKIRFFTERLENAVGGADPTAAGFYEKIQKATDRMNRLIKDLLDFSRLSSKANERFVPTDLGIIMDDISQDLELLIQQKDAILQIEPLPVIEAVPLQMQQLFYNLVSNSLKFSRQDIAPVIQISSSRATPQLLQAHGFDATDEYCLITVADNGIGFEQEYAQQIFVIFQRLNDLYTYGGTGIGLALCKKIVLNHHGKIFAEGKEDAGAVFSILLPVIQKESMEPLLQQNLVQ